MFQHSNFQTRPKKSYQVGKMSQQKSSSYPLYIGYQPLFLSLYLPLEHPKLNDGQKYKEPPGVIPCTPQKKLYKVT